MLHNAHGSFEGFLWMDFFGINGGEPSMPHSSDRYVMEHLVMEHLFQLKNYYCYHSSLVCSPLERQQNFDQQNMVHWVYLSMWEDYHHHWCLVCCRVVCVGGKAVTSFLMSARMFLLSYSIYHQRETLSEGVQETFLLISWNCASSTENNNEDWNLTRRSCFFFLSI